MEKKIVPTFGLHTRWRLERPLMKKKTPKRSPFRPTRAYLPAILTVNFLLKTSEFLNKKVFGLGKRASGGLRWPLLKCSFQDTYWATYTCLIGMNKLYLGSKNFLLTTSILESASNIIFGLSRDRSRPFRHLKFCLKWFQSSYRAYILCEELKLKFFTPQKNFEIVRPQIRGHSRPP